MPGLTRPTSGGYTVRSPIGTDNQQTFSKRKQAVQVHRVVTAGASSRGQALATVTRLGVRHPPPRLAQEPMMMSK